MSEEPRWLSPEQAHTWLALYSVMEWLPKRLDEQLKRNSGISMHDYFILAQISMAPSQELTMSDLAALAGMTPSRLSHSVARLEGRGWVERHQSVVDKRTNIATLTDTGRELVRRAAPGHAGEVLRLIFDNLTEEENRQFDAILRKFLEPLAPPQLPRTTEDSPTA